ncbi:MAG: hypothetical protein ACREP9_20435 [Candidatus Dormibacteraceae bacterium]
MVVLGTGRRVQRLLAALLLSLVLGTASAASADDNDACAHMLPEALRAQVLKDNPHYRFLRVDDYSADDIQSERQYHQGSPCLAAASGDYFGEGRTSYAFMLLSDTSYAVVLVAHQNIKGQWEIGKIGDVWHMDYVRGSFNQYVNTTPAGKYHDVVLEEGVDPKDLAAEAGWVSDITSDKPGIAIGTIEASEVAYFFEKGHWVFTNVED